MRSIGSNNAPSILAYNTNKAERETLTHYMDEITDLLGIDRIGDLTISRGGNSRDTDGTYFGFASSKTSIDGTLKPTPTMIAITRELVNGGVSARAIEILNHEIGHHLELTVLTQADQATQEALAEAFIDDMIELRTVPELADALQKIRDSGNTRKTPYVLYSLLGGPVQVRAGLLSLENGGQGTLDNLYVQSFGEWHAQGWAREITRLNSVETTSFNNTVESYFKGLGQKFRDLFDIIRGRDNAALGIRPSQEVFADYVRGVVESAGVRPDVNPKTFRNNTFEIDNSNRGTTFRNSTTGGFGPGENARPLFRQSNNFVDAGSVDFIGIGRAARTQAAPLPTPPAPPATPGNRFFSVPARALRDTGNRGTRDHVGNVEQNQSIYRSLPSAKTDVIPQDQVQARAEQFMKDNGITLKPTFITSNDIPDSVLLDRDAQSPGARIVGYTDVEGNSVIVTDNVRNREELEQAIFDETFHGGLSTVLGNQYTREMRRMIKALGDTEGVIKFAERFDPDFTARYAGLISQVQANPRDAAARFQLMEEAIAKTLGHPQVPRGVRRGFQRIASALKDFIRKRFPSFRENHVSDYEVFKLARRATRANQSSRFGGGDGSTRFFLGGVGSDVYTRDADGVLYATGKDGTNPVPTIRQRATDSTRKVQDTGAEWISDHAEGNTGAFRKWFRESAGWNWFKETFYNIHAGAVTFDREIGRNTSPTFVNDTFGILNAATEYLADRPMLRGLINDAVTETDKFLALQPGAGISTYLNIAKDRVQRMRLSTGDTMIELEIDLEASMKGLQKAMGGIVSQKKVAEAVNSYMTALHTNDRNTEMWYRVGARQNLKGADRDAHQKLVQSLDSNPGNITELKAFVDERMSYDPDYVASGYTNAEAQVVINKINADPALKVFYDESVKAAKAIQTATNEVNRLNGRWSDTWQKRIDSFGWQDTYVPLQGNGENQHQGFASLYESALDQDYDVVDGRDTFPDPLGAIVANAQKSYEYLAANDVAKRIAINMAAFENSTEFQAADRRKIFSGSQREYGVNSPAFKKLMLKPDPNRIIYFNPDNANLPRDQQTAIVMRLNTKAGVTAIKGERTPTSDRIEKGLRKIGIPQTTSFIGSLKTFRNVAFLPFELIRTTLTYGYNIGNDQDFDAIAEFAGNLMQPNYIGDIKNVAGFLARRDIAGLDAFLAEQGEGSVAHELGKFMELGGLSTFLDSVALEPLGNLPGVSLTNDQLRNINAFFTQWNNVTDLVGRFAYYQTKVGRGVAPEIAAAEALNLANFGARGRTSGPLGGIYSFFRATVSGAVGQIDNALDGQNTGPMMAVGAGLGMVMYTGALMMSGENEEEENIVAKMNGKRFIRDFSFNIFDQNARLPLGFGAFPVAIATGIQLLRASLGHQSLQQTADNILSAAKDNASVVPTSGIGVIEHPFGFAIDSLMPSVIRPGYQVLANINGLGFDVYSGDPGDTYAARTGTRGGLEEAISLSVQETFGRLPVVPDSVNPDIIKHLGQQYLGGMWSAINAVHELTQEFGSGDPDHDFSPRRGTYVLSQFFGPEYFTQTAEDYYNIRNSVLEQRELIKDAEDANRPREYLQQLENDPLYQARLPIVEAAEDRMRETSETYKSRIWDTRATASSRETAYDTWWLERYESMTDANNQLERDGLN